MGRQLLRGLRRDLGHDTRGLTDLPNLLPPSDAPVQSQSSLSAFCNSPHSDLISTNPATQQHLPTRSFSSNL